MQKTFSIITNVGMGQSMCQLVLVISPHQCYAGRNRRPLI